MKKAKIKKLKKIKIPKKKNMTNSNPYISRETFQFMVELDKGDLDDYTDFK